MANVRPSRNKQLKLYEGWLEHKSTNETKWKKLWCVLKGRILYFFTSDKTAQENHNGTLAVTPDSCFTNKEGDSRKGWKFELYTGKRLNKFKTKMFSERELWRAYIIGMCSGDIPPDLDLPPEQQQQVRDTLQLCLQVLQAPPLPCPTRPDSPVSRKSGLDSPHDSADGVFITPEIVTPLCDGGPTIRHKFWPDPSRTDKPTWFFEGITRHDAENILTNCGCHGNTLMRESVTFRNTGSYVITKRMQYARVEFNHFEVTRVAEGFRINVENTHKPMTCLSEVMDFFVTMSGLQSTHPMSTNNTKDLELNVPDYQTKIFKTTHDDESGEELDEDYEEPKEVMSSAKTWSQSKLNKEQGRSNRSQTMIVGQRDTRTSLVQDEISNRVNAATIIGDLDTTLDRYSEDRQSYVEESTYSYENESVIKQMRELKTAPPPPGPPPKCNKNTLGIYANDSLATRTRRKSVNIFAKEEVEMLRVPQNRSRSNSVPNIYPPGCNFNVSVPVSSQVPPPAMVPPQQNPSSVRSLKDQFETDTASSPHMSSSASAGNLRPNTQRKATEKAKKPPPTKRKTWCSPHQQRSYSSLSAPTLYTSHKAVGVGNLDVGGTNTTLPLSERTDYYDDACTGAVAVSFSIPEGQPITDKASFQPKRRQSESDASDSHIVSVMSSGVGTNVIKAQLEKMLAGGPRPVSMGAAPSRPSVTSQQPEIILDECEEDYEDISNYVNIE